jgi:hypothetical protein
MGPKVAPSSPAVAIPVVASQWLLAAALQWTTQHIHGLQYNSSIPGDSTAPIPAYAKPLLLLLVLLLYEKNKITRSPVAVVGVWEPRVGCNR